MSRISRDSRKSGSTNAARLRKPSWKDPRLIIGILLVLASVAASAVLPRAKWIGAGGGGGLVFAAASNTCMMGNLLSKLPYNRGPACDIDQALTRLGAR